MRGFALGLCVALGMSGGVLAQTGEAGADETLADIRQELTVLWGQVQRLNQELSTTGFPDGAQPTGGPLERLDAIERELQRLTARTEELENRVVQVVRDGTNRVGDLEFRLCELEPGCDIATLGDTPSLGGEAPVLSGPAIIQPAGPALAVAEREQFDAAMAAMDAGEFLTAANLFAGFADSFPGGPLTPRAHYLRGESLESLNQTANAARAFLAAFSASPSGEVAPDALFKLGTSLGALGQTRDACVTLGEVPLRFPDAEAALDAQSARANLGCS